jgi:hypothetical protein
MPSLHQPASIPPFALHSSTRPSSGYHITSDTTSVAHRPHTLYILFLSIVESLRAFLFIVVPLSVSGLEPGRARPHQPCPTSPRAPSNTPPLSLPPPCTAIAVSSTDPCRARRSPAVKRNTLTFGGPFIWDTLLRMKPCFRHELHCSSCASAPTPAYCYAYHPNSVRYSKCMRCARAHTHRRLFR